MKRFPLFFAAVALIAWLGCDKAKNPAAPEKSAIEKNETELADTAAKASLAVIKVPDDYATIQTAVEAANPGTKIIVKSSGSPYNEVVFITKPDIEITARGLVTLNGNFGVGANNVKISHFNINVLVPPGPGLDGGISVGAVTGVEISHNTITGVGRGIFLNGSTGCLLKKNTCTGVTFGIGLYFNTHDNTLVHNTCTGNAIGISITGSDNNKVLGNDCSSNSERGLDLNNGSDGAMIKNNVFNHNGYEGIAVTLSCNQNKIGPGNTANFNNVGIWFSDSNDNTVTNNDFHCNSFGDIIDNGAGNQFFKNSTGPLPECQ